ncbi:hypothetical protein EUA06_17695 [Nocardioides glacieisoli]|uniref:Uncharacterized protein n=1 Tax=Nocardioides glacieisoli TaxID=1168730 RepID=A0A4Q2RJR7_9ACTN|nr:hypothetical protein EUA06_17695 [Nocardioides glacieisoli]
MIYPLVLGSGHRLFGPDDHAHGLQLVSATPTVAGVLPPRTSAEVKTS